jgi:hypothetical protein
MRRNRQVAFCTTKERIHLIKLIRQ